MMTFPWKVLKAIFQNHQPGYVVHIADIPMTSPWKSRDRSGALGSEALPRSSRPAARRPRRARPRSEGKVMGSGDLIIADSWDNVWPIGSMYAIYMVTFTINITPMLAYIPYMDPMGDNCCFFFQMMGFVFSTFKWLHMIVHDVRGSQ